METKIALVDSIENIKDKITSQEYRELLKNLNAIKISNDNTSSDDTNSDNDTSSVTSEIIENDYKREYDRALKIIERAKYDIEKAKYDIEKALSVSDLAQHKIERSKQKRKARLAKLPDKKVKVWTTSGIQEINIRQHHISSDFARPIIGFTRPIKISTELANFLGIPEDVYITRPDITKCITKYIKEHDLQKKENRRIIDLTKSGGQVLKDLLRIPNDIELNFFNLQKYLHIHFP
jgi:chromatin remodeling complex protein RSC6